MIQFLATHICPILLILTQAVFMHRKNAFLFAISTTAIALFTLCYHKFMVFEVMAVLSVFICIVHNRKYRASGIYYLGLLSCGLFMLAVKELHPDLLNDIFSRIAGEKYEDFASIATHIYTLVALLLLVGMMPFSEWIMYLFALSNSFYKMVCFIVPLFLLLQIMQEIALNISNYAIVYTGFAICIYTGIYLLFESNIRRIYTYLILYFFGLQVIFISNGMMQIMMPFWVIISILIATISCIFTPFRVRKYTLENVKEYFCSKLSDKILACLSFNIIIGLFAAYAIIINHGENISELNSLYKIGIIVLFIGFLARVFYAILLKNNSKNKVVVDKIDKKFKKLFARNRLKRIIWLNIIFYITALEVFLNRYFFIGNLHIPTYQHLLVYGTAFCVFFVLTPFMLSGQKPILLRSNYYFRATRSCLSFVCIFVRIVATTFSDFWKALRQYAVTIVNASTSYKLTHILCNNYTYFYIFILIQMIIVLTIECVIT